MMVLTEGASPVLIFRIEGDAVVLVQDRKVAVGSDRDTRISQPLTSGVTLK